MKKLFSFFIFFILLSFLKNRAKRQHLFILILKKKNIKEDKVLGNLLAGQKLVFRVCLDKPVACLED